MDKAHASDRIDESHKRQPSHNLLPEELHKPTGFRWPLKAGNGESFVPNLTLFDGSNHEAKGPSGGDGKHQALGKSAPAHGDARSLNAGKSQQPDGNHSEHHQAAWTVGKGETLYGKAERMLHAEGKPNAHYSPEQVRAEVVANAERNHWVKGADAAISPEDKQRRSQFDSYLKDGNASHLPKDLNGMVHKSMNEPESDGKNGPAIDATKDPARKSNSKPNQESGKADPKGGSHDGNGADSKERKSQPDEPTGQKVTDLKGRVCAVQPKGDQFPSLDGKASHGCGYRSPDDAKHPENKELADIFSKGKESTVNIDVDMGRGHGGGKGSGVIIGKSEDGSKVYVATDNHVASPEINRHGAPAKRREVTMPDGKHYPAQLALKDPKHDRAVLSVDVGPGNADKYQAAAFSDKPGEKGDGVVLGFPDDSRSVYASPAKLGGVMKADQLFGGPGDLLKGEQANRPQMYMPKTHTEEGVSGGPIFNSEGKVVGLLEGGGKGNPRTGKHEYWSYGNPTSRAEVENWLAQIKAQAK